MTLLSSYFQRTLQTSLKAGRTQSPRLLCPLRRSPVNHARLAQQSSPLGCVMMLSLPSHLPMVLEAIFKGPGGALHPRATPSPNLPHHYTLKAYKSSSLMNNCHFQVYIECYLESICGTPCESHLRTCLSMWTSDCTVSSSRYNTSLSPWEYIYSLYSDSEPSRYLSLRYLGPALEPPLWHLGNRFSPLYVSIPDLDRYF